LSDGGGEVDVPLLTFLALDELNFGWKTHMAVSSHITSYKAIKKRTQQCVYLVTAKFQPTAQAVGTDSKNDQKSPAGAKEPWRPGGGRI
jgi:hypothetical protein